MVESELVQISLEEEKQKNDKSHKQDISQIEHNCKESLQRSLPLGYILKIQLICLEISLETSLKLDSLLLELSQLMHTIILSDFPLLRLPFFHKISGPKDVNERVNEDKDVVEASQGAGSY